MMQSINIMAFDWLTFQTSLNGCTNLQQFSFILFSHPEAVLNEKNGVWGPMPELTISQIISFSSIG
jgi:hypothetical protein